VDRPVTSSTPTTTTHRSLISQADFDHLRGCHRSSQAAVRAAHARRAEVKLENLISRGRLGDARLAAEQARYRTVQYAEALRQKLDATRRDVRSVDWLAAVPALLDEALTHIEGRYRAETAILANIEIARDDATVSEQRRQAADLVTVGGCDVSDLVLL
jgi:hypothetical protein